MNRMSKSDYRRYARAARRNHDEIYDPGSANAVIRSSFYEADAAKRKHSGLIAALSLGGLAALAAVGYAFAYGVIPF